MGMFPELPDLPPEQRASQPGVLRYEDVAQDGRLLLAALPHHLGPVVFQTLLVKHEATRHNAHLGILPILSRLVIEAGAGPVSVRRPVVARGGFELAHTVDEAGQVNRLLLDMWAEVAAPIGRTNGPRPEGAGTEVVVGRVYGEHVFTRPFAPAAERKVTRFPPGPWPEVPETCRTWRKPDEVLALPVGARWLEPEAHADPAPVVFGLVHTDSNQHVNSLVYPRFFEDAALRRLAELGRSTQVLGRFVEIAYRKPFFAGQRARIILRAYEQGNTSGVIGVFQPEGEQAARPSAALRLELA